MTFERHALVTGAARGLGEGIARRLARDGWAVTLVDRATDVGETAEALAAELRLPGDRLLAQVADVAEEAAVEGVVAAAVRRYGGLELAVANAGIGGPGVPLVDLDPADFDRVVAVNLRGVYLTCRAAGRVMRQAGRGSIVTISSILGEEPAANSAAYGASKAAVIALTRALALELAPHGVRVNCVAPGNMATEMHWEELRFRAARHGTSFEEEREAVVQSVPLGRHGTADDVGAAVAFLASDDAAYVTGHVLDVNGGVLVR